jgi:hypothetical protein
MGALVVQGMERDGRGTYLNDFSALEFDVASVNAGAHVLHYDGAGSGVDEDTAVVF